MSALSYILDQTQKLIKEEQVFEGSHVFSREERLEDQPVESFKIPTVYLEPLPIRPETSDFRMTQRNYALRIVVKIQGRGKGYLPTEADRESVNLRLYEMADALMDMIPGFPLDDTEGGHESGIYHVSQREPLDLNYKPAPEILKRDQENGGNMRRISVIWEFHTVQRYSN